MAWIARLASRERIDESFPGDQTGPHLRMVVEYFDDVTPGTILYTRTFNFSNTELTQANVAEAVRLEGKRLQATMTKIDTAVGLFPVGTTLTV